jgi:ATPase family associated with various cellular activities (AAA)
MNKGRYFSRLQNDDKATCYGQTSQDLSTDSKLIPYLISEYGGIEFILTLVESILIFIKRFFPKNKKYQSTLSFLKYAIPVFVLISDLISKLKSFFEFKSGKNTALNVQETKIKNILNLKSISINQISYDEHYFGTEVSQWLLNNPKTKIFKIINYFRYDNLQQIDDNYKDCDTAIITLIEFESKKFIWLSKNDRDIDNELVVKSSQLIYQSVDLSWILKFKLTIYKEFINHLNITNNILILNTEGLNVYPRQNVVENSYQFDIDNLAKEIRKTLNKKKKRGYVFVGVPGTGKSTIIRKLESIITEFPILYLSPSCFYSTHSVKTTFNIISYIQPCIVVIEDLDSCGFQEKTPILGELLEQIDDVDNRITAVFLTSLNDTTLVNYSLLNRPGRLDQVIKISPPKDSKEIYEIMKCRYFKNTQIDNFILLKNIDKKIFKKIIKMNFTQADICEIIEKALLLKNEINNDSLNESIKCLEMSKQAIKDCAFSGSNNV